MVSYQKGKIVDHGLSVFRDVIYSPFVQNKICENIAHCITDEDFFKANLQDEISNIFQAHEVLMYQKAFVKK